MTRSHLHCRPTFGLAVAAFVLFVLVTIAVTVLICTTKRCRWMLIVTLSGSCEAAGYLCRVIFIKKATYGGVARANFWASFQPPCPEHLFLVCLQPPMCPCKSSSSSHRQFLLVQIMSWLACELCRLGCNAPRCQLSNNSPVVQTPGKSPHRCEVAEAKACGWHLFRR